MCLHSLIYVYAGISTRLSVKPKLKKLEAGKSATRCEISRSEKRLSLMLMAQGHGGRMKVAPGEVKA